MHLYIHIPFCHEICPYCSFYKHKPGRESQSAFIDALLLEFDWWSDRHPLAFETIYFGGGTPSLLSEKNLTRLLTGLQKRISFSQLREVTLEANPSTFSLKKAQLFKTLGITRVSLGVQSFDDPLLKNLGRDHSRAAAIEAYHILREAELPEINIDLMFSVPEQTKPQWEETIQTTIELEPDHLSAYNLTYEEDTAYFKKFLSGEYKDLPELNEELFLSAHNQLTSAGYQHYETSNYSKPGAQSKHNKGYWKGNNYLGIGPSAVGCIERIRSKNVADTAQYIQRINAVGHAIEEQETLSDDDWRLERIALELRTESGLPMKYLTEQKNEVSQLIQNSLAREVGQQLQLTLRGACVADSVAEFLC